MSSDLLRSLGVSEEEIRQAKECAVKDIQDENNDGKRRSKDSSRRRKKIQRDV